MSKVLKRSSTLSSCVVCAMLAACAVAKQPLPPTKPTSTTAFVVTSDYVASAKLLAIDLETRAVSEVLGGDVVPLDPLVRVFDRSLYLVGRDFLGANNNWTVLDPDNGYQPKCAGACQFSLGDAYNARDLVVVDEHKAYLASAISNVIDIVDPLSGARLGEIDVGAARRLVGDPLHELDSDGLYDAERMIVVDRHLFVAFKLLKNFTPIESDADDGCGYVAGRVAVIDLDQDKVVKMIRLRGANPDGPFVREPGTNNILISTTGTQIDFAIEKCNGIERIDAERLLWNGMYVTEEAMGGTVFSFSVDADGNGVAFVGMGDFEVPEYQIVRFRGDRGRVGEPLFAPGADALTFFGFMAGNDRGQAYVSLPYAGQAPALAAFELASGQMIDGKTISLTQSPVGIGFYPGESLESD